MRVFEILVKIFIAFIGVATLIASIAFFMKFYQPTTSKDPKDWLDALSFLHLIFPTIAELLEHMALN